MNDVPSQPAPREEDDPAMGDWAEALKERGRPTRVLAEDWTRRRLALIGIVISHLFPFYQHAVHTYGASREPKLPCQLHGRRLRSCEQWPEFQRR